MPQNNDIAELLQGTQEALIAEFVEWIDEHVEDLSGFEYWAISDRLQAFITELKPLILLELRTANSKQAYS